MIAFVLYGVMLGALIGAVCAQTDIKTREKTARKDGYREGYTAACRKLGAKHLRESAEYFEALREKDETIAYWRDQTIDRRVNRELMGNG